MNKIIVLKEELFPGAREMNEQEVKEFGRCMWEKEQAELQRRITLTQPLDGVYDPRKRSICRSNNPALLIGNMLKRIFNDAGIKMDEDQWELIGLMADVCDGKEEI
jgi:hypothetical protein